MQRHLISQAVAAVSAVRSQAELLGEDEDRLAAVKQGEEDGCSKAGRVGGRLFGAVGQRMVHTHTRDRETTQTKRRATSGMWKGSPRGVRNLERVYVGGAESRCEHIKPTTRVLRTLVLPRLVHLLRPGRGSRFFTLSSSSDETGGRPSTWHTTQVAAAHLRLPPVSVLIVPASLSHPLPTRSPARSATHLTHRAFDRLHKMGRQRPSSPSTIHIRRPPLDEPPRSIPQAQMQP